MKQKISEKQSGFTLIEMLVVIGIMGLIASIFIANFSAFRGPRDLKIAQNELISNIRKVQSYTLSSRNSPDGKPVKFYYLEFKNTAGNNGSYRIVAINNDYTVTPVETVALPTGVIIRSSVGAPEGLQLEQPVGAAVTYPACMEVAYSTPFGRIHMDNSCTISTLATNAASLAFLQNSKLTITLEETATNMTKAVVINGISGVVCAPATGNAC